MYNTRTYITKYRIMILKVFSGLNSTDTSFMHNNFPHSVWEDGRAKLIASHNENQ